MPTTPFSSDEVLLLAYSVGNGASGLKLAMSDDGYTFCALNRGKSVWTGAAGEARLVRNPAIHLGPDGTLHCVWTTGSNEARIGYCRTRDLRSWTPQRTIDPWDDRPGIGVTRILVDPTLGHFVLCAPHPHGGVIGTITTDFSHFEPAKTLFDHQARIADASIVRDYVRGRWTLFATDVRSPARGGGVFLAGSSRLDGPYEKVREPFTGPAAAATPNAVRVGDRWFCYIARPDDGTASLLTSRDFDNWQDETDALALPMGVRAFTTIVVPRALVARFEA